MPKTSSSEARSTSEQCSEVISNALHSSFPAMANLNQALASAESLYPFYSSYLQALFTKLELAGSVAMMIALQVAKRSKCYYLWKHNLALARALGLSPEQIDALEIGEFRGGGCFDVRQRAALRFTEETMLLVEVKDPTYAEVKRYFSDRAITEMLYIIGTYMFLSRLLRTGRVPLDDGQVTV